MEETDVLDAADAALDVYFDGGHEEVERDVAPAAEEAPSERPRDEQGRFVSQEETVEVAEEAAEAETDNLEVVSEEPVDNPEVVTDEFIELDIDDPEILSFLDKYDGDVLAALKAATEAQSLIGRQGTELGSARGELEELRALREEVAQSRQEAALQRQASSYDWDTLIAEEPAKAAQLAVQMRDPIMLERVVEAWGEEDPFQAMMFMNQLAQFAAQEAAEQSAQPQDLTGEIEALKQRIPDLQEYLPAIEKLAAERPILRQALYEGDPHSRAQALEDLHSLAKSQVTPDTSVAKKIYLRAKAEADAAKADAAVVSATNQSLAEVPVVKPNEKFEEVLQGVFGDDFVVE